ncbi:MAG: hypothetical protein H6Q47_104 [Deltaproteobacteria bacterium]|nr:hypothetical protein [Deltaproteobacteria bacterium]
MGEKWIQDTGKDIFCRILRLKCCTWLEYKGRMLHILDDSTLGFLDPQLKNIGMSYFKVE